MVGLRIALVAALSSSLSGPVPSSTSLDPDIAKSLDGGQCVKFRWDPTQHGSPKGGISIPVVLNDRAFWFQLDTGTNVDIMYGDLPDKAKWSNPTEHHFRARTLRIGTTVIDRPLVSVLRDQPMEETSGEIGLADLIGRVTVIDYPRQRFCIFAAADLPPHLRQTARWIEGDLRDGKFFLPVKADGYVADGIIFDTGSSELPLWIDLAPWLKLTRLGSLEQAPTQITGAAFNKPIVFKGAPSSSPISVGDDVLGMKTIYTKVGDPTEFSRISYKVQGVMGNEPFWNDTVVLDLADAYTRFGLLKDMPR